MEDPRRNMAAGSTGKRKLKGRTPKREPLTIMVLKRTGTVWTGKVSALVLMGAGVFLCCYIVITLVVIYQHLELTRGQRFVIKRFKTISSRYALTSPLNEPLILKILVYDEQGNVIFNKTVEA
jgi:hypothetical protein